MLKTKACNDAISSWVQGGRSAAATLDHNDGTVDEQPNDDGGGNLAYTHLSLTISFYKGFYEHSDSLVADDNGKPTLSTMSLIPSKSDLDVRQAWIVLHELSHATGRYIRHDLPTSTSNETVNRRIYDACVKPWMQSRP